MMRRLLGWILGIGVLVWAAVWLADHPGSVSLQWQGWRVDTSVAFLLGCVAAVALATAIVYRALATVWQVPRRLLFLRRGNRRERGYRALTQGLVAVAAGDAAEAQRLAKRADDLLGEPPLTMLLSAQAAQLTGDDAAAKRHFSGMLGTQETAFLALRGLLMQAQRAGDEDAALDYARRAFALRPRTPWVVTTLFDLQIKRGLWPEALTTIETGAKHGIFTGQDATRRRVVTLLACSAEAGDAGDARMALDQARRAHGLAPEFVAATLRLAGLQIGGGRGRAAAKLIQDAWAAGPHPELARLYLSIHDGEDPIARMRRIERLVSHNPSHPESHLALAGAAMEANIWGTARGHLEAADTAGGRDARLCRLRADVEEAEHGDVDAVRHWLLAASDAPPDPAWVCESCAAAWRLWSPVCGRCEAFATLAWSSPERVRELAAAPAGVASAADAPAAAAPAAETESLPPPEAPPRDPEPGPEDITFTESRPARAEPRA